MKTYKKLLKDRAIENLCLLFMKNNLSLGEVWGEVLIDDCVMLLIIQKLFAILRFKWGAVFKSFG